MKRVVGGREARYTLHHTHPGYMPVYTTLHIHHPMHPGYTMLHPAAPGVIAAPTVVSEQQPGLKTGIMPG